MFGSWMGWDLRPLARMGGRTLSTDGKTTSHINILYQIYQSILKSQFQRVCEAKFVDESVHAPLEIILASNGAFTVRLQRKRQFPPTFVALPGKACRAASDLCNLR